MVTTRARRRQERSPFGVRIVAARLLTGALLLVAASPSWSAGPLLDVAESVVPVGETVKVTVLGEPGHHFALAASTLDAGLSVQGMPLELGPDAVIVATGQLDARGRATRSLASPFAPNGPARLFLQAVTGRTAEFEELAVTPGKVLRVAPSVMTTVTAPVAEPHGLVAGTVRAGEDLRAASPAPPPGETGTLRVGPLVGLTGRPPPGSAPDITAVVAGPGLHGGGESGAVTLEVAFAGSGATATVARSDHTHDNRYYTRGQIDARSKWISIDPLAVYYRSGASVETGFGINAGLWLPGGPTDLPAFEFGFALPPDYTAGTDVAVQVLWHINQTGCTVNLTSNYVSIDHYGAVPSGSSFGFRVGDPVPSTANQVARTTFTVRSAMLSPGDSVIVGLFRSYNNDTCNQPLQIKGIRVLYD